MSVENQSEVAESWVDERLTEIKGIKDPLKRVEALVSLAAEMLPSRAEVLEQALEAANSLQNEGLKAQALTAIAPQLKESDRLTALKQALDAAQAIEDESSRARALGAIAPQLRESTPELLKQALESAQALPSEYDRAQVLGAIAPQLRESTPELLKQALEAAQALPSEYDRAQALSAIAPQLSESDRLTALKQFLEAAQALPSEHSRALALGAIAPQLSESTPELLKQALDAAQAIQFEDDRAQALGAIASQLSESTPELLKQFLDAVQALQSGYFRAQALGAIAPQLSESTPKLLKQFLDAAQALPSESSRAQALGAIAPQLSESDRLTALKQALDAAQDLQSGHYRAQALSAIAPQLRESTPELLKQFLDAANALTSENYRSQDLSANAPQLRESTPELLKQFLDAAQALPSEHYRAQALSAIAPQLSESTPELLKQALDAAQALPSEHYRAQALSAIAPQLSESDRLTALKQFLDAAQALQSEDDRAQALGAIAPRLPASEQHEVLQLALEAANSIQAPRHYSHILVEIAPKLPEKTERSKVLEEAVAATKEIKQENKKADSLILVAQKLLCFEQSILQDILKIALQIQATETREKALQEIVSPTFRDNFLAKGLISVAEKFDETDIAFVLQKSLDFSNGNSVNMLCSLAERFPEELVLQFPSDRLSLALDIVEKGKQKDAVKTRFLSALAPRLSVASVGLFPTALRLIRDSIEDHDYRTDAVCNLTPYIPEGLFSEAITLIDTKITDLSNKTEAFEGLIPHLPLNKLSEVLNIFEEEKSLPEKTRIFAQVAVNLNSEKFEQFRSELTSTDQHSSHNQSTTQIDSEETRQNKLYTDLVKKIFKHTSDLIVNWTDDKNGILSSLFPLIHETEQREIAKNLKKINNNQKVELLRKLAPLPFLPHGSNLSDIFESWLENGDPENSDFNQYFIQIYNSKWLSNRENQEKVKKFINSLDGSDHSLENKAELSSHLAICTSRLPTEFYPNEISSFLQNYSYALQKLRDVKKPQKKVDILKLLLPDLPDAKRLEAADIARNIETKDKEAAKARAEALIYLACKFPEFRSEAADIAHLLQDPIEKISALSKLAVEVPERLLDIIKILNGLKTTTTGDSKPISSGDNAQKSEIDKKEQEHVLKPEDQKNILTKLSNHLPIRINREVNREVKREINREVNREAEVYPDLWKRAIKLLSRSYRDALQGGSLRNESNQAEDLLNLKDEVNALADLLLMRYLEPPMTVGILGGWGGGKSYIMHLMQTHMTEVRSRKVNLKTETWNPDPNHEKLSPYVGHIYQIKFDAWTFAKSDLWASLMQTIFTELNRQISLEQQLARVLADNPEDEESRKKVLCEASNYWPVLYKASDEDRQWFLDRVLSPAQLTKFKEVHNQGQFDDQLWQQLGDTYKEENIKLSKLEATLEHQQKELIKKKQAIRTSIRDLRFNEIPIIWLLIREINPMAGILFLQSLSDNKLDKLIESLTGTVSIILSNRISRQFLQKIKQDILAKVKKELDSDAEGALEQLDTDHLKATVQAVVTTVFDNCYGEISFRSFCTWFKKNLRLFGLLLVFLALSILLPIAAARLLGWLDGFFPKLIAFLTPLTPGIASAQALLKSSQKWFEETNLAVKEYETKLEALPQQLEARREQIFEKQLEKDKEISSLEGEIKALEEKVNAQRKRIPKNVYASLESFVSDRLQSGSYQKHLGLMQQVKDDLADLSQRLLPPPASSKEFQWKIDQLQKVFPRGPARVIVYIDDLDRCPPDRVVQVLEAIQLLVKTPLFIAVLAIDERYITRALEQHYKGILLRHGSPSGTDYLEKIIQLPYRVRPIMAPALENYLRSQVVIQDNATGSTKFSEFSRQEFNMLLRCCEQVDLSPRSLKRLTNVYKLFKIVCRTRGTKLRTQVQQAIFALLALSCRYPDLMRGIFDEIETCFEEQRTEAKAKSIDEAKAKRRRINVSEVKSPSLHKTSPLKDFFENYQLPDSDRYLQRELDQLMHDAIHTTILPDLTLEDMSHPIFNLIRSFSFVGEIGEDSEGDRVSGPAENGRGRYSKEELARHSDEIYENQVLPQVEAGN